MTIYSNNIGSRQAGEEPAAIGFLYDTGVENGDNALVVDGANESADSLTEFHEGIGKGEFAEGVASLVIVLKKDSNVPLALIIRSVSAIRWSHHGYAFTIAFTWAESGVLEDMLGYL